MPDRKPLGRVRSPDDPRDFGLMALTPEAAEGVVTLPTSFAVSTAAYVGRLNQQENSCVGHSTAFSKIVEERKNLGRYYSISPLWLWDRAKERDGIGNPTADRGTYIRSALDVLVELGATVARADATADARFKIAAYYRLTTIYQIKLAIYKFGPVVFGTEWFDSWFSPSSNGMLPVPDTSAGGHAIAGVAWSNGIACPDGTKGAFRCPNSWDESWGYRGDFWLPYSMIGDGKPADEAWRMQDVIT